MNNVFLKKSAVMRSDTPREIPSTQSYFTNSKKIHSISFKFDLCHFSDQRPRDICFRGSYLQREGVKQPLPVVNNLSVSLQPNIQGQIVEAGNPKNDVTRIKKNILEPIAEKSNSNSISSDEILNIQDILNAQILTQPPKIPPLHLSSLTKSNFSSQLALTSNSTSPSSMEQFDQILPNQIQRSSDALFKKRAQHLQKHSFSHHQLNKTRIHKIKKPDKNKKIVISNIKFYHQKKHHVFSDITFLEIKDKKISNLDVILIAHQFPSITILDLSFCNYFDDLGLYSIADTCRNLEFIDLTGCNQISSIGINRLRENCPNLKRIELQYCKQISDEYKQLLIHK